jgi:hypothetical protein
MTLTLNSTSIPWAALLPIIALAVGFVVYCLIDLARSRVRYLPKWVWAIICLFSVPFGGIIYLLVGREHTDGRT